ncbi:MAG TPA: 3-oxoacyl-[acyl-carrier-protein] synthase III C-terminal domain-containing protein [Pseudonocardia sp.]|uniref:3-oxoacyl-[acyl-carrier-protein] synthase III C-terminal domain-containing protein n=1 Tax=Pseudonocardia sp. TaxID=60912 RepID=UPI002BE5DA0F|nr:3-oxoacyl-[acyl-carrier-protein] synthase III C-terminal domain-containing protein [Pseudonocardia sp.]HTF50394.1 3-oxoacyl-[acyl-carrier-protein] synthase III C-terminal domain-containing protein [Pseudonocardia sp.]
MKPFVINRHGRLVFPANFLGELDFSALDTLEQFTAVIERDFEAKAPTGSDILSRVESGAYPGRFDLLRDLGQNLFWVNRFPITMFEKRPTRWRDVAKHRDDVFLPVLTPWEDGERKVAAVERAYQELPATWDSAIEDKVFALLFDLFRHKRHHATELPAIKPTVAEFLDQPDALTFVMPTHDPDYPVFSIEQIIDADEEVPELEALMRWAMVLHNQYPWERSRTELRRPAEIGDDDFVVAFHPRNRDVMAFIDRVKSKRAAGQNAAVPAKQEPIVAVAPETPYPPVRVREAFAVQPVFESLAVMRGEHVCDNVDVIRNTSFSWSLMSAAEIAAKTGIQQRRYSSLGLEQLALGAAKAALAKSGRGPEEIGAVLVSTCTSSRSIPSVACWLSGELGVLQTHTSVDMVAACAGMPYGLGEAIRQLQEVNRPVLLVCVEKFSDKIGSTRTSRMIFGDGAAAMVIAPAPPGATGDIAVVQTYASGPRSEVNSIIWPNPEFDNDLTVYGPEVKSLVRRYLVQMIDELGAQSDPDQPGRTLLESVELIVPHQANKPMILNLADKAGLSADQLYFNIEMMGNVSAASIPIAVHDAVRDGVINRPTQIFAPGFGAGAVGGYTVMRIDPAIVADEVVLDAAGVANGRSASVSRASGTTTDDVRVAFGE